MSQADAMSAAECLCILDCRDDPATRCSLAGDWHVHPGEPCPVHPDAPGDHAVEEPQPAREPYYVNFGFTDDEVAQGEDFGRYDFPNLRRER
jgi:hypothetical protein